jgi:peptidoglycan L-alanyl-D-glutamate endopeptidase CwlK
MFSFGRKSSEVRETLCDELKLIVDSAIQVYNFSMIEGHRDQETQDRYFAKGVTKVKWPNGKHNTYPSDAVDLWPYVTNLAGIRVSSALSGHPDQIKALAKATGKTEKRIWELVLQEYATMKGVLMAFGKVHGVELRFGDDWDRDHDRLDQSFIDLPHVEVVR